MGKRDWLLRKNCAEQGCTEVARYYYSTKRDMMESYANKHEFRCVRHSAPGEVLSSENAMTEKTIVSVKGAGDKLYWEGSGFKSGPGFKAFADDFPEGTRLIITARIETPNA